ncbi:MAG TPA: metal-dependent hydrolase [Vicinamibacterales bacterium]|nr:metal-dependent hydrolase [Vicinamibacterales bacterium]
MPSPVGHALAGLAAAWAIDLTPGDRAWRTASPTAPWYQRAGNGLTLACGALAVAPDLDLFFGSHREMTHSLGAVVLVTLVAVAWALVLDRPPGRVAVMCAVAYSTHLFLDWLGADTHPPYGLQLLWPVSKAWFISGFNIFPETARQHLLSGTTIRQNLVAVTWEVILVGPLALVLWLVRVKALAGFPTEVPGSHHAAK